MHKINSVLMQYFHWYSSADGTLWKQLAENASDLSKAGITAVWLPPAYKGVAGGIDVGYGVFDLFDLGEFDQKGSIRTKYGTREEYLEAIKVAQKENIQVYSDIVFNHKMGADNDEEFNATPYDDWFKPIACALILLRKDGYPCIFSADYYGANYKDFGKDGEEYEIDMPSHRWIIDKFLEARQKYAYGNQYDYFDHPNCVGWTRTGDEDHKGGIAVICSNGNDGHKNMQTASPKTTYIDITEHITEPVETNDEGWGEFRCPAGSVSVWVAV